MLEKVKTTISGLKEDAHRRKEEKEQLARERREAEAKAEAERIAAEKARIQAEKDTLMSMDTKELLVEAVIALRGLHSQIENLESDQAALSERLEELASDVGDLTYKMSISEMDK